MRAPPDGWVGRTEAAGLRVFVSSRDARRLWRSRGPADLCLSLSDVDDVFAHVPVTVT